MSKIYEIAKEEDSITIRLSSELVDQEALQRLLDYLELESIRKNSELTEQQAAELADEVDLDVWQQVKHKYTGDKELKTGLEQKGFDRFYKPLE